MTLPLPGARIFVDTNAYGAFMIARDQHHDRAVRLLTEWSRSRRQLVTSNFIIAETHALILGRAGRDVALNMVHLVERGSTRIIRVDEADEIRARRILEHHHDKDYSLTDATSFAIMERLGIGEAFTFDRHFRQFGFQVLGLDE